VGVVTFWGPTFSSTCTVRRQKLVGKIPTVCLETLQQSAPFAHLTVFFSLHKENYLDITRHFTFDVSVFIRRSLFSSFFGSCHDREVTWQEIGRVCGSACSCRHRGSRIVVPLSVPVFWRRTGTWEVVPGARRSRFSGPVESHADIDYSINYTPRAWLEAVCTIITSAKEVVFV